MLLNFASLSPHTNMIHSHPKLFNTCLNPSKTSTQFTVLFLYAYTYPRVLHDAYLTYHLHCTILSWTFFAPTPKLPTAVSFTIFGPNFGIKFSHEKWTPSYVPPRVYFHILIETFYFNINISWCRCISWGLVSLHLSFCSIMICAFLHWCQRILVLPMINSL